jgi:hypothetical protein
VINGKSFELMAKKKLNHFMFLKIVNFSLFLLISALLFPYSSHSNELLLVQNNRENPASTALEKTIMKEINLARTNPIAYADLLENLLRANTTKQKKRASVSSH